MHDLKIPKTISNQITIKRSHFNTILCSINSKADLHTFLNQHIDSKATHNCYAYLFYDQQQYGGMDDDGEPKNTAGRPIFKVIGKNQLNNVCILVNRYYGGIKLGTNGLTRAYVKAASEIIKVYKSQQKE